MQISFRLLLPLSLVLVIRALTVPENRVLAIPPENGSDGVLGLGEAVLGLPTPPAEFSIIYQIGGPRAPKLHQTALLMNTIAALKTLALADWDGKVSDGTEYKLDNYPQVSIWVSTPKRLRTIRTRYIVWSIVKGVYEMIRRKRIELSQFELRWDGDLVGWVHIEPNSPSNPTLSLGGGNSSEDPRSNVAKREGLLGPSSISMPKEDSNGTGAAPLLSIGADPKEARLVTHFTPFGTTLSIYDVFVPIMGGLAELAPLELSSRTNVFVEGREGYKGCICLTSTPLFRAEPPYLEHHWITRALARVLGYMLESRRFGEVNIVLEVDGVGIARGKVGKWENCVPETDAARD